MISVAPIIGLCIATNKYYPSPKKFREVLGDQDAHNISKMPDSTTNKSLWQIIYI